MAQGDEAAFRSLYDLFYHDLLRYLLRITRRLDLAEEGVNDVMLVVWRKAATFRGDSKVSTWILGIATRRAFKLTKRSQRWLHRFIPTEPQALEKAPDPRPPAGSEEELYDWLDAGFAQLSPGHRAVVELTYVMGYSYREIAAILGCPVNTVKTRMFNARRKLRKILPPLAGAGAQPR